MPGETAKIILAATHSKLTKVRDAFVTEDSINSVRCKFEFRTSDWDKTFKTAMFVAGEAKPFTPSDEIIPMTLDENNECDVPFEVLKDGTFSVGVFGVADNGRIVSNWTYHRIADGCFAEGAESLKPTPSVYEQILATIKNHTHDGYITEEEINEIIKENVSQSISEIFGSDTIDAGPINEY